MAATIKIFDTYLLKRVDYFTSIGKDNSNVFNG